jgi:hypothetical protein
VHLAQGEGDVVQHAHVREQVERLEDDDDGRAHHVGVDPGVGDVDAVRRDGAIVDDLQQVDAPQQRRAVVGLRGLDLGLQHRVVDDAEDGDQPGVLLQRDQVVQQRRDDPAKRLRHHHVSHRLRVRQPERAGGRPLRRVHGLDAGAQDLGDVRAVGQDQRGAASEQRRRRHPVDLQRQHPEAEQEQHQDHGRPRNRSA